MGGALNRLTKAAADGEQLEPYSVPVLTALVGVLAGDANALQHELGRGLDSRVIVGDCIEYAEAGNRVPALSELCTVAHVSERRLRSAFSEEFDQSPTRFFGMWALDRAYRRMRDAGTDECTVTDVADNLGRFSSYDKGVYGETPSTTLRASGF